MKLAGILGHCMTTTELFQQSIKAMPPSASGSLRAPANFGAIQVANSRIEQQRTAGEIPEELAALWLLHDGQSEGDDAFPGFAFLPLAKAISEYSELCYLMKENDPDRFDSYPPKRELWEKWFDPVLFPFGWTPGGSGCLYLIHIENGRIWRFNSDVSVLVHHCRRVV
jgi:hypothetical protein